MNINLDFASFIDQYDRETTLNTIQSLALIATRSTTVASIFDSSPELKDAKTALSGILTFFTIRSTYNSVEKIYSNSKKQGLEGSKKLIAALETTSSIIGIAIGIIGMTRSLATFKLIDLEQFSSALGYIPVAQTLGQISSLLTISTSVISISIESIKIHERSKEIDRLKARTLSWTQPIDLDFVKRKIATQIQKHDEWVAKTEKLSQEIINNQNEKKIAKIAYREQKLGDKDKTGIAKFRSWRDLRAKKSALKKLDVKQLSIEKVLNQMNEGEAKSFEKLTAWKKINSKWDNLSADDNQMIAQFQVDKTAKWEGKTKSLKIEQIKAAVGLGLKVVGVIISIASLILSMTGVGLVPVLTTMAVIGLVLALANLGFTLFKRHTSPKIMESVPVPILA